MRALTSPQQMAALYASSFEACAVLASPGNAAPERVMAGFRVQATQVALGLQAVVERAACERAALIVEGVHLVPGLLPQPRRNVLSVPLLLVVRSADEHRRRFLARAQETFGQRAAARYLGCFEEIRALQAGLEAAARELRVPVLESDAPELLPRALGLIERAATSGGDTPTPPTPNDPPYRATTP